MYGVDRAEGPLSLGSSAVESPPFELLPDESSSSEAERLRVLDSYHILDSAPEAGFDAIVALAAERFAAPIALISLVADRRQWFKARVGLAACETPREVSFCAHALRSDGPLVVLDATADPRFAANPLVCGAPHIRFYAGAPLIVGSGHRLGTLCVIDTVARCDFSSDDQRTLAQMAALVVEHLEFRRLREYGRVSALIAQTTSDAFVCADADNRIIYWNRAAESMFGWPAAEVLGRSLSMIVPERLRGAHRDGMSRVREGGTPRLFDQTVVVPALRRDGTELPVELSLAAWSDTDTGRPAGFAAVIRDVSARQALEAERERAQAFLDIVVDNVPAMLFVKDAESRRYLLLNRAGEDATGLARADVIGRTDLELFPDAAAGYAARDSELLRTDEVSTFESSFRRNDGETRLLRTRRVAIAGADGRPLVLGITEDVTERRSAQARIDYLAHHDDLTGLANRVRFGTVLGDAIAAGEAAVLCIDLDRFKAVNDLYGHAAGDALLVEAAQRLRNCTDDGDLVARLGGDEFALVLNGGSASGAAQTAARAVAALAAPYCLDGRIAHVEASIGIAMAPGDGASAMELLHNADMALYRAKEAGRGTFCFFEPAMDLAARQRRELELELRIGLGRGEVMLAYQPLACLETGRVDGFEALARWHHPTRGVVGPDLFIPIAEDSGLIIELGRHVLRTAINEAARWQPPLKVAVNLSPLQFLHGDLAGEVAQFLDAAGLDPARLELEITEGLLIRDTERALALLRRLKAIGVRIALDDFGTGYSSLSYFRQFPFDKVKIDRSFVREMATNPQALAVVQAVIGLGRGLGMPVVAEGIETDAQLTALRAEGCTQGQGYLLGRPEPIAHFDGVVVKRAADPEAQLPPARLTMAG